MLREKRRKQVKGMKWVRIQLTAREDVRWKKAIFSLPKYADGLDCNVSPTESNFRKLFLSEKKIKYIIF